MADGLYAFCAHMVDVARQVHDGPAPAKVQRFVRMHEAGLPLDLTVRWYPATALEEMEARVRELTAQGRQVWISQGLPWDASAQDAWASVEKRTDLVKKVNSTEDFFRVAVPRLEDWDQGSWAKLYYDTPIRSLIGGSIGFDTNRAESLMDRDSRAVRLEVASGISDVRDLNRQMTARHVLVAYRDRDLFSQIKSALEYTDWPSHGVGELSRLATAVREMGPGEPRAVIIEATTATPEVVELLDDLKSVEETASVPLIAILSEGEPCPEELLARVSDVLYLPLLAERVRASIFRTGFRVEGDALGFDLDLPEDVALGEVHHLLRLVMGAGGSTRRMMMRVANLEARPTIAFEFKVVPVAPYQFFFLDYEWSGAQHPLHRFDWLYSYSAF